MCATHSRSDFVWYRDCVTGLMREGTEFGEVEDAIELAQLNEDQKAALWLLAFSMKDRRDQLSYATTHLAAVAD